MAAAVVISGRGIAVPVVLPPSLSFLFPIILMAGFLTSKKSSALNPIIARQIISPILNRPAFAASARLAYLVDLLEFFF